MNPFDPYIPKILALFGKKSAKAAETRQEQNTSQEYETHSIHAASLRNTAEILKDADGGSMRQADHNWDEL